MSKPATLDQSGIVLRAFVETGKSDQLPNVLTRVEHSIRRANDLGFGNIVVVIPTEKDFGGTFAELTHRLKKDLHTFTAVVSVHTSEGDENSDALNEGVRRLREAGSTYGFFFSAKAMPFFKAYNLKNMLAALTEGAWIVPLALRDTSVGERHDAVYQGVLEGRPDSSFVAFRIRGVLLVDGFDSRQGVEWMSVTARLVHKFGACIAPVLPVSQGPLNVDASRIERHRELAASKRERQQKELARVGQSFSYLMRGVIEGYPR